MNAVAIQLNAAGDPIATAAAIAPIAKTLNTLNLYETRRRRALKTVQEELDLLTQAAAEAQAKLRAATPAPTEIGSVHSSLSSLTFDQQLEAAGGRVQDLVRYYESQQTPAAVAEVRQLAAL